MEILISASFFVLGYFFGYRGAIKKQKCIYKREYGILNGLMAPQRRK